MPTINVPLIEGGTRGVDTDNLSSAADMSNAEKNAMGVGQGTHIVEDDAGDIVDTFSTMSLQDFLTAYGAAIAERAIGDIGDSIDTGLALAGPFTLAAFTQPAAGGILTIPATGKWIVFAKGNVRNSDVANCYPTLGWMVNGVQVAPISTLGSVGLGLDGAVAMWASSLGVYVGNFTLNDTISCGVSVSPGGVAGDEITIDNYNVTAIRVR